MIDRPLGRFLDRPGRREAALLEDAEQQLSIHFIMRVLKQMKFFRMRN
jgi:hypothetical protein